MSAIDTEARVLSVSLSPQHGFSKQPQPCIHLLAGQGVQGDAHCGSTVQHLYLKRRNPQSPNRMQVHLLPSELFLECAAHGINVQPGQLGENVTTEGIDLLHLPLGTRLRLGADAVVELTGLRTPCAKIDTFRPGLLALVTGHGGRLHAVPRAGVMAVVLQGGTISPGDPIRCEFPENCKPMSQI